MTNTDRPTKQVIVMRKDLNMRKGKMIAQGAHASMAFMTRRLAPCCSRNDAVKFRLTAAEEAWLRESFTKICVSVDSEEELFLIAQKARDLRVECNMIQDNGWTEFNNVPTYTCLALGPDYADKIDAITSHLRLL
jgi:PTH2 family peptidyl-tRNA hydrolase